MNSRALALLAAFGATTIYGLNHTIAKVVMPHFIGPFGFIMLRVVGASVLFWTISLFVPKETIERKDYLRIAGAAFLGMCINMLMFFKGLQLSTPINSGVIVTLTPIIILILSAFFLKEKLTLFKFLGIVLGFTGAIILILYGNTTQVLNAPNIPLGNTMLLINATSFGAYLVMVKPLTKKYSTITLMKWMFLIGIFYTFPVTYSEFSEVSWTTLPFEAIWRMGFVVVGTTFMTYMLNVYALKTLSPTAIGAFTYLQPLITILYAVITGNDILDGVKILACLLVFVGVYLVSKKGKTYR
ncbi:DMT family transporter [Flavobacteriaceae bacterium]|jgi:drug/metabolite transporter (DMT)-like permease|nr:DMT family transporter [Flavobacteriaceae bacterium]MDC0917242.1 DMT family transporter [Flavobacteriaceae bacterium]MDC3329517.1 DMT family transporter [Flavobacteriaceae bacterium]